MTWKILKPKLSRPSGKVEEIPCQCSPENTLALEFTPTEPGKHVIDVTKRGKPVKGSPFEVVVEEEEPSAKAPTVGSECDVKFGHPRTQLTKRLQVFRGNTQTTQQTNRGTIETCPQRQQHHRC